MGPTRENLVTNPLAALSLDNPLLIFQQACLQFVTSVQTGLELWAQSTECLGCDLFKISGDVKNGSRFVVNATYGTHIKVCNACHQFL